MVSIEALEEKLRAVIDIPVLYNRRPDFFPCFVISFYGMESGLVGNGKAAEVTEGCMLEFWYKHDFLKNKRIAKKIRDIIGEAYAEPEVSYDSDPSVNAYRTYFRFRYILDEGDSDEKRQERKIEQD